MLEKTEVAIKNWQSRETGNIGYTRHKTKTNKTKSTTQYVLDTTTRKKKDKTPHKQHKYDSRPLTNNSR